MPRSLSAVVLPGDPTTALQSSTRQYIDAAVALKATDTAVVHLAGTETLTGTKIFSAPPQIAQGTLAYHPVRLDDPSLTNARTPSAHATSHAIGGTDVLTPAAIGAELTTNKGAASGYAALDISIKVPFAQLPTGTGASQVAIGSHTHSSSGGYASGTVASGSTTPTIVHNLGTRAVSVIIQEVSTGLIVPVAVETVDATGTGSTSTVRLTFTTAPTAGQYSYLILAGAPVSAQMVPIPPSTLVDASTIATDASLSTHFRLTSATGDRTLGIPTNPTDGQRNLWEITADSTQRVLTLTQGATDAFEATTSAPNPTLTIPGTKTGLLAAVYSLTRRRWTVLGMGVTL